MDESSAVTAVTVRASIEVAVDGANFTAPTTLEFTEPDGTSDGKFSGTATGTRLAVQPMGTPVGTLTDLVGDAAATPEAGASSAA